MAADRLHDEIVHFANKHPGGGRRNVYDKALRRIVVARPGHAQPLVLASNDLTSPARTIADCFRFERLVGAEVALEALHDGLRQRRVSIAELVRAEEVFPSRRLRAALELGAL